MAQKPAILSGQKAKIMERRQLSVLREVWFSAFGFRTLLALSVLCIATRAGAAKPASAASEPAPSTPREFFNAGTKQLHERKLREEEAFFESTLASQQPRFQPAALYNLGHVRFGQGV